MARSPSIPPESDDYSIAKTLIRFPRPLPLLRRPVEARTPAGTQYVLAFRTPLDWASAYASCKSQIAARCESGARIGCSISASEKCRPPWWKFLLGTGSSKRELAERVECEEMEMEACVSAAREKCSLFARQKCAPAFENAWIETTGGLNRKEACRLISGICFAGAAKSWGEFPRVRRGRDVFDCSDIEACLQTRR